MKLNILTYFIIGLLFVSCEYDYDMDSNFKGVFTPTVVVNSTINPDSTIKVSLYWSNRISDTSKYKIVERFRAKIYEDSKIIVNEDGVNGLLSTQLYPKEGSKYRLEIDVPDYGKLSAETSIPFAPEVEIEYDKNILNNYGGYHYFNINNITTKEATRSVMIRAIGLYKEREYKFAYNFYANNSFFDLFNAVGDGHEAALKGSSIGHDFYIRVPYKNIEQSIPMNFSVSHFRTYNEIIITGYDDFGFPIYDSKKHKSTHIVIEVIAPSKEYDKYHKSAYQQVAQFSSIFSEIYPIHSNIENGVGIFAGYSSVNFIKEMKYDE